MCPQPTATTRLKQVGKVREARASPRVPTPPDPPAQVPTGEMMLLHHTNLLTGAPWSPPLLHVPLHPPRGLVALGTLPDLPRWTLVQHVLYSQSHPETAPNPASLILSGECVCLGDHADRGCDRCCSTIRNEPLSLKKCAGHAQILLLVLLCQRLSGSQFTHKHTHNIYK